MAQSLLEIGVHISLKVLGGCHHCNVLRMFLEEVEYD